ncbi:hypothetical protein DTO195F2_3133 [Paecilomyces variotii]|nr:hypothetical protein DTO195F2_3133 [Paecilomyces variotii]KAJ9373711.1 hypothetical protein DTO282E5_1495 [Paecilomyces variotii]
MIAATSTVLLGTLASVVTAQTVDIFLPEYGRYSDSLVAQSVGENAGVTSYLIECGPQTVTSISCFAQPTGVGRDGETPPICTGDSSYNTYTRGSCVAAGATLLEGPSTIVFINPSDNGVSIDCSVAGTVSAVCTQTFSDLGHEKVWVDTISGEDFSFYHVPLTTGLAANGPLPTLNAGGQASTSSAPPVTSSSISLSPKITASMAAPSTTPSTTSSTTPSTTPSASTTSSNAAVASSSSFSPLNNTTSNATKPATNGSSNTTTVTPIATEAISGATALTLWVTGAAAAAVVAAAAII